MVIPSIRDFSIEAHDPACYAELSGDWAIAVADVIASTILVAQGRDREINFVAGAVVAVLASTMGTPSSPNACQFGGDGAVATIPPDRIALAGKTLQALAHWAKTEFDIPLRVGLVPVHELTAKGHHVYAALHDFGKGNVFGQFLGSGVAVAESWVKSDAKWRLDPAPGELPGLDELSCRWRPIPSARGTVMCIIIDPVEQSTAASLLSTIKTELEAIISTSLAAPLGHGQRTELKIPTWQSLSTELKTQLGWRKIPRLLRALTGYALMKIALHCKNQRLGPLDMPTYKKAQAERSDYRKMAGGPRFILDVTWDEALRITAMLTDFEAKGLINFGTATADATVMTCLVGDFAADRHVHFVDGSKLGYWRAATILKGKLKKPL